MKPSKQISRMECRTLPSLITVIKSLEICQAHYFHNWVLTAHTPKRRREDDTVTPIKSNFKYRSLKCGTDDITAHGLGERVLVKSRGEMREKTSPYAHLTKSIYVTRVQND